MASKTFENFITLTQYFDSEDDALENVELQTNQEEILGFFSEAEGDNWGWSPSPEQIEVSLLLDGEVQIINKNNIKAYFIADGYTTDISEQLYFLQDADEVDIKNQILLNLITLKDVEGLSDFTEILQGIFKFTYLYNSQNVIKILPYRLGTSRDMAKLNVNASDITAAIQSTKLKFGREGLQVFDGGFKIYNSPQEQATDEDLIFAVYPASGGLMVKGEVHASSGTFTGVVHAQSGEFTGKVTAKTGEIGGFYIDGSILKSENTYFSEEEGKELSSIILDGAEGIIVANSIVLGEKAQIDKYIKLGNAYLYNPDKNENGELLTSGQISLKDDGTMTIGKIEINGSETGSIQCGNSWWIRGDGTASFNDIYANNVHLQDAVLEATTIQAVGSLMLFKDSWFVRARNGNTITLEGTAPLNLSKDDYIYDGSGWYKITEEVEQDSLNVTLDKEWASDKTIATKFGTPGKDFIFTLQGESVQRENQRGFATGNSLTVSEFSEQDGDLVYKKVLVLGDLGQLNTQGNNDHSGTGLYAENVELYGSLTTPIQTGDLNQTTYAGINTKSTITSNHFENEPIIFFAGAKNKEDITNSTFYVTNSGKLYASAGTFKGAIITEGIIEGSEIKTAKLYGSNEGTGAALSIYDTAKGIAFKTIKEDESEHETLLINNNQFSFCGKNFISLNEIEGIIFNGNGIKVNSLPINNNGVMTILGNKISNSISNKICFNGEGIIFNLEDVNSENCSFEVNNSRITSKVSANFYQDVNIGNNGTILTYKPVENGYDLYVQ